MCTLLGWRLTVLLLFACASRLMSALADIVTSGLSKLRPAIARTAVLDIRGKRKSVAAAMKLVKMVTSCAPLNNWGKNALRVYHGKELVPEKLAVRRPCRATAQGAT
ncbi:predicted protein [Verticillium alfalfae VaMs.102]|uniref:Predicted protein n=1 Tax=Verticillium alfalfae (strain VaMs.102 / ATCC MYA-4576 / FGSC 10136) TaxID=526221 RepID=C9SQP7_VERA1|nr:predicted protein [Verticillium alfalfae VaMs.102]EEY21172.1 predicted protein [Verticillium alfalfae VaMs.102]